MGWGFSLKPSSSGQGNLRAAQTPGRSWDEHSHLIHTDKLFKLVI